MKQTKRYVLLVLTTCASVFVLLHAMKFIEFYQQASLMLTDISFKKQAWERVQRSHERNTFTNSLALWKRKDTPVVLNHCTKWGNKKMIHAKTRYAIVSLISTDLEHYVPSAIKLAKSVRWWFTADQMDLVMMMTNQNRAAHDAHFKFELERSGWNICMIPVIDHTKNLIFSPGNRFFKAKMYSKLNVFALNEYEAVLFLDSDTLVVNEPSLLFTHHLMEMKKARLNLGAARDSPVQLSHYFNAGVLLILFDDKQLTFDNMIASISQVKHEANQAEQGLLNILYNNSFYVLPFIYNANLVSKAIEPEIWKHNSNDISILHYTVSKG